MLGICLLLPKPDNFMKKLLFIPLNSREISQMNLVIPFIKNDFAIQAISFRNQESEILKKNNISFKQAQDYKTFNAIDVLKKENPSIVVADFCGPFMNAFIMAANYLNIPILQIDDGITADYSPYNKNSFISKISKIIKSFFKFLFSSQKRNSYLFFYNTFFAINGLSFKSINKFFNEFYKFLFPLPIYAPGLNIAVLGPFAKQAYIKMGAPEDKIFITGQPRFDKLIANAIDSDLIKKEIGIDLNKKIVFLATQPLLGYLWSQQEWELFNKTIIQSVLKIDQAQLIIKLHPEENREVFQDFLKKNNYNIRLFQNEFNLYDLIACCDVLVTFNSTVALEAMILKKSVVTVNLTGKQDLYPYYSQSKAALLADKPDQVKRIIESSLFDQNIKQEMQKKQEEFLYDQVYLLDGKASQRTGEVIKKLSK